MNEQPLRVHSSPDSVDFHPRRFKLAMAWLGLVMLGGDCSRDGSRYLILSKLKYRRPLYFHADAIRYLSRGLDRLTEARDMSKPEKSKLFVKL